jgi:hypothetical protein
MLLLVGEDRVIDATADGVASFAGPLRDTNGRLMLPSSPAAGGGGLTESLPVPPPQDASSAANTIGRIDLNIAMASL